VVLIHSRHDEATWRDRLKLEGPLVVLAPEEDETSKLAGTRCVAAAARLLGVIDEARLLEAVRAELGPLGPTVVEKNVEVARRAYAEVAEGWVRAKPSPTAESYVAPEWVDLRSDDVAVAAPAIHGGKTSELQETGLWRTTKPVVDREQCHRCSWLCGSYCPDGAIHLDEEGYPLIDYQHCKGCMVCAVQCPHHAIRIVPEDGAPAEGGRA
jgi:pyruvate ferredoxin oxidoreductase gamma subunit